MTTRNGDLVCAAQTAVADSIRVEPLASSDKPAPDKPADKPKPTAGGGGGGGGGDKRKLDLDLLTGDWFEVCFTSRHAIVIWFANV